MTGEPSLEDVIARLKSLQSGTVLPPKAKQTADRLIARLQSPVRIALLGPRKGGKSTLRNMLAGARIVPDDIPLPTSQLSYGEKEKITATLADGTSRDIAGLDFAELHRLAPVFAEIYAPWPALKKFSLLEVVTDDKPKDVVAATKWAARRSEIAIWVTPDFTQQEQTLWTKAPEDMKDHGFLVLSKVDKIPAATRSHHMARMEDIAAREFHSFFPTATRQGLTAIENRDARDSKAFKASGCEALRDSLLRHVELGNQADFDGALQFLNRYKPAAVALVEPAAAAPGSAAVPQPDEARAKAAPKAADAAANLQIEDAFSPQQSDDHDAQYDAQQDALARLRSSARDMLDEVAHAGTDAPEMVLNHCFQTIEDLAASLSEAGRLFEPAMEASDVIVLLQLEKSEAAAEDAIITLLQLRREIEHAIAA